MRSITVLTLVDIFRVSCRKTHIKVGPAVGSYGGISHHGASQSSRHRGWVTRDTLPGPGGVGWDPFVPQHKLEPKWDLETGKLWQPDQRRPIPPRDVVDRIAEQEAGIYSMDYYDKRILTQRPEMRDKMKQFMKTFHDAFLELKANFTEKPRSQDAYQNYTAFQKEWRQKVADLKKYKHTIIISSENQQRIDEQQKEKEKTQADVDHFKAVVGPILLEKHGRNVTKKDVDAFLKNREIEKGWVLDPLTRLVFMCDQGNINSFRPGGGGKFQAQGGGCGPGKYMPVKEDLHKYMTWYINTIRKDNKTYQWLKSGQWREDMKTKPEVYDRMFKACKLDSWTRSINPIALQRRAKPGQQEFELVKEDRKKGSLFDLVDPRKPDAELDLIPESNSSLYFKAYERGDFTYDEWTEEARKGPFGVPLKTVKAAAVPLLPHEEWNFSRHPRTGEISPDRHPFSLKGTVMSRRDKVRHKRELHMFINRDRVAASGVYTDQRILNMRWRKAEKKGLTTPDPSEVTAGNQKGKKAGKKLWQISPNVQISVPVAALMGLFVGSGIAFRVLYRRKQLRNDDVTHPVTHPLCRSS